MQVVTVDGSTKRLQCQPVLTTSNGLRWASRDWKSMSGFLETGDDDRWRMKVLPEDSSWNETTEDGRYRGKGVAQKNEKHENNFPP